MIQNEHQYKVSQDKSKEIEEILEQLEKGKHTLNSRQFAMRKNGLRGILAEIQEEILSYSMKINQ
jgi:HTH-type transcriptional regulator / antitoxin HipB